MDGELFIALPGVNNSHDEAVQIVKKLKLRNEVFVAFDNDYYDKKEIQEAFERLKKKFKEAGISIYRVGFNLGYKGFDDYLLAKARGECA